MAESASTARASEAPEPAVSVVVPVKDEAGNVRPLVDETRAALGPVCAYEIVYVDDGSGDGTTEELEELLRQVPELRAVRHARSCGQSAAIATGVKAARGAVIATLDGDGQNDPADIPALLETFRAAGEPDLTMIAGHRQKRHDTWLRRFSSRTANGVRASLLGDDTPDTGCGLKVFSRAAFLDMPRFDHMHRFLPALMIRRGGRVQSVRVNHRPRSVGRSKYGLWNRLWVGIVDLLGVMWLKSRGSRPEVTPLGVDETAPTEELMNARLLLKGMTLFATLAALAIVVHETDIEGAFSPAFGRGLVESHGVMGHLIFIGVGALFTGVGLPRQAMSFAAGYTFGFWQGLPVAALAVTLGCVLAFFYARFLGREMVRSRYPERVQRIDRFLAENPMSMPLLIRFLPVGSNLATNLAAGVSSVPAAAFIVGSAIGYLPQTVVFSLIGGGTTLPAGINVAVGAVLFVVSGAIGILLYRRYRRGKAAFDEATEHELVPEEALAAGGARSGD